MNHAIPIDLNTWPRKDHFTFYSGISCPYYVVNFRTEVTPLYHWAREHGVSFYLSMVHLCTEAVNEIEAFRYAIRDGRVVLLEGRDPVFCDLKKGSDLFHITAMERIADREEFCRKAKAKSLSQQSFLEEEIGDDAIIFSCLPWLDITALTNEHEMRAENCNDDTDLIIAWGKFEEIEERKILNISIDVNHRFIDGLTIGRFSQNIEEKMAALT